MIFAIDPGSFQSAIVAFDGKRIHYAQILPNERALAMFRRSGASLRGANVTIEMIGHYGTGMPAGKDVFVTCLIIGAMREICEAHGAKVSLVLRKTIVSALCGTVKASDANVGQALRDKYGEKGTKAAPGFFFGFHKDLWSAMAVADYALTHP